MRRYRVKGMNCNHCRANVEKALRSVSGVKQVEVSLKEEMAVVEGTCEEPLLVEAVQSLGFDIYLLEGDDA